MERSTAMRIALSSVLSTLAVVMKHSACMALRITSCCHHMYAVTTYMQLCIIGCSPQPILHGYICSMCKDAPQHKRMCLPSWPHHYLLQACPLLAFIAPRPSRLLTPTRRSLQGQRRPQQMHQLEPRL
jgi:hypothetical protein